MDKQFNIMDKVHNILAGVTGDEQIGFLDTSKQSLYGKFRAFPFTTSGEGSWHTSLLIKTTVVAASIAFNPLFWNLVAQSGTYHHEPS